MTFLDDHWDKIVNTNIVIPGAPPGTPWDSWHYQPKGMAMIVTAIKLLQPTMVIETGTFMGYGTVEMAKAMSSYADSGFSFLSPPVLWTIDAGVPVDGADGSLFNLVPVDLAIPEWKDWPKVISKREENLAKTFPGLQIKYLEGIAWDVLPPLLEKERPWDFIFQDSCHHPAQVQKEWEYFRDYSHLGSVVVFDDQSDNGEGDFTNWFRNNEQDWIFKHIITGDLAPGIGRLWVERIR